MAHATALEGAPDEACECHRDGVAHEESARGTEELAEATGHARENREAHGAHEQVDAAGRCRLAGREEQRYEDDDGGLQREGYRAERDGEQA